MAIVEKSLKQTDISKRFTLPSKSLKYFPRLSGKEHMVDFDVRDDDDGHVRKFRVYTRKGKKYLKPVITKGWRDFVCSKELQVGDKVAFYLEEEQASPVKYRVKVQKQVKIFGAVVFTP
ncbi:hypothetical protein CCACVL1_16278 [Corchorus capsularis]|uniref:TF-B3 domain-containing protein n=1 Tax=Corchorus capsularis TaxID=210143 RepID=A0A1R3HYA5_COCAP|nr:hypothetical protein CCACVL1_16278 [Corchorus capsularis]